MNVSYGVSVAQVYEEYDKKVSSIIFIETRTSLQAILFSPDANGALHLIFPPQK